MPRDRPLAVLVVGDDPLARSGLAALLAGDPGLAVVGQSATIEVADRSEIGTSGSAAANVALWDLGLHPGPTLEALADAAESGPPIVALLPDDEAAAEAYAAGARGLLFRDAELVRLAAALRAVAEGLAVLDADLAGLLAPPIEEAEDEAPRPLGEGPAEPLTPRELEVLQLLAQGLSNKQIAARLAISEHTAKFHVAAILGKLGAEGRTDAVVRAARSGLILL